MIQIVRPSLNELYQVVHLFEAYRAFYRQPTDPTRATQFIQDRITQADSVIFLAINEAHEEVGFVQLYPLFSSTRMKKLWLLNDLFVVPHYRGKGISKLLIQQSKDLAIQSGAAGVMLETEKSNTIGNQLYVQTGFSLDCDHNYYWWGNPQ